MNNYNHIVFGPVPSRRLGRSIGINNILPKHCSYSCIYCQLGRTNHMSIHRDSFYDPDVIIQKTEEKINQLQNKKERIDYITIVSDGEPTLDIQIGSLIMKLQKFSFPIAVITNSSLLYDKQVRADLAHADLVSVKIDAIKKETWKKIDRPYASLSLNKILHGIKQFSDHFIGTLITETMLIHKINDSEDELNKIAEYIQNIEIKKSYLSIPTRPPAESWVNPASEKTLIHAYQIFTSHFIPTEFLIAYEGDDFAFSGDAKQELLSILSVHPMRKDAIEKFLKKANKSYTLIDNLLKNNEIVKHSLNNQIYFSRKIPKR